MVKLDNLSLHQLRELKFLVEHDEYDKMPARDIIEFIESAGYLDAKDECWDSIKQDLKDKKHLRSSSNQSKLSLSKYFITKSLLDWKI